MVIRAVLLKIIDRRRKQQDSEFVSTDSLMNEDGLPIAKRTRRSSSSAFSFSSSSSFCGSPEKPTTDIRRQSSRLLGSEPVYNERSLDDVARAVRTYQHHYTVNAAQFEGYCPRHGTYNEEIVLRDHNHDTEVLACYCRDESGAALFDNVVFEVSYELGICVDTVKNWVSYIFLTQRCIVSSLTDNIFLLYFRLK